MKKIDVLRKVAEKTGFAQKNIEEVLTAYVETVFENAEDTVPLPGVGKFAVKDVPERSGVSTLGDGKPWTVPAHKELKFTISKSVKTI